MDRRPLALLIALVIFGYGTFANPDLQNQASDFSEQVRSRGWRLCVQQRHPIRGECTGHAHASSSPGLFHTACTVLGRGPGPQ